MKIEDKDFYRLHTYMQKQFGINLQKKRTLVEGRLSNTIQMAGYDNFHDYIDDCLKDSSGEKVQELLAKLTTNYTYFMREEIHYEFMQKVALPEWTQKIRDRDLRIWSAGCSSGEEAYTAAMVINEWFGGNKKGWDSTILATDISPRVLGVAKAGTYPLESLDRLPESWKKKYFVKAGEESVKVGPKLEREVVFGQFNLMGNFSKFRKKFHIIFCRNVMIYFDAPTKTALTNRFYDVLEPGGYLFIGMSETLTGINDRFRQISPAIYRKD